jgi:hypothetical protein
MTRAAAFWMMVFLKIAKFPRRQVSSASSRREKRSTVDPVLARSSLTARRRFIGCCRSDSGPATAAVNRALVLAALRSELPPCGANHRLVRPGGTFDNSPAIYRWVANSIATNRSPGGTAERRCCMAHTYTSSLFHCVWSTRERHRMITAELRERLWPYLGGIAK